MCCVRGLFGERPVWDFDTRFYSGKDGGGGGGPKEVARTGGVSNKQAKTAAAIQRLRKTQNTNLKKIELLEQQVFFLSLGFDTLLYHLSRVVQFIKEQKAAKAYATSGRKELARSHLIVG